MNKKNWTSLLYLNGNNELAIEMEKTLNHIVNMEDGDTENNIIVQISKGPIELVNIIRQGNYEYVKPWQGVNRYEVVQGELILKEHFEGINLCNYKSLYDFLTWGIKNYPADRYMVAIAGHGYIINAFSDFSGEKPCTMGVYEMLYAINLIKKKLKVDIDILVLDICNMNTVEILYELGKDKDPGVKNLLTYVQEGPLTGMPYDVILSKLKNGTTADILKNMVKDIYYDIVAVEINPSKLQLIKEKAKEIAREYAINQREDIPAKNKAIQELYELLPLLEDNILAWRTKATNIYKFFFLCTIGTSFKNPMELSDFYSKLQFSKDNSCLKIISRENKGNSKEPLTLEEFRVFQPGDIGWYIKCYNPNLTNEQLTILVSKLYNIKGWKP